MTYTSTRDDSLSVTAAQAIRTGLAADGGLFVPACLDGLRLNLRALRDKSYPEIAFEVLRLFLPDYSPDFLQEALRQSYGESFGGKAGHLRRLSDTLHVLELWHGPTAAFKDYALQLMPRLLAQAKRQLNDEGETLVLVATSGDTGSAALAGYSDVPGVKIAVFYPQDGTSALQRLQMTTQQGKNVAVYGVRGNFDDAQRGVKAAFTDKALAQTLARRGQRLTSANSINWGRLAPQIVYYVAGYLALWRQGRIRCGDPVDFCVPTGNFGDILAGWYARAIGLPVGRLVCASNKNNVLYDFFETGCYDSRRAFYTTSSPSMDILVSSNLERLLWHAGGGSGPVARWMDELAQTGRYTVDAAALARITAIFAGGWAGEAAVSAELARVYAEYGYLCDPHTAVAFGVQRRLAAKNGGGSPMVVLSTASPFKFCADVLRALGQAAPDDPFDALRALERYTGQAAPSAVACLAGRPQRFTGALPPEDIPRVPLRM